MGIFDEMPALRTLKIGVYHQVAEFNIPLLLENSYGLKALEVYVKTEMQFKSQILNAFIVG